MKPYSIQAPMILGGEISEAEVIAPFGKSLAMSRLVTMMLFPDRCFRSLYHRGSQLGQRVMNFKSSQLSHQQARAWREAHPLSVPVNTHSARTLS